MDIALLLSATLLLALANGANDNFKGMATVWGCGLLGYRAALALATVATMAGAVAATLLASALVASFSGRGLVDASLLGSSGFLGAVAAGAGATVLLASRLGLPVSTTHALVGALCGSGLVQAGTVHAGALLAVFVLPLLLSPVLAAGVAWLAGRVAVRLAARAPECLCLETAPRVVMQHAGTALLAPAAATVYAGRDRDCSPSGGAGTVRLRRTVLGDAAHLVSAFAVCLARGVNDTPKIAALLIASGAAGQLSSQLAVGLAMGIGGLVWSGRVARTMSLRISAIDRGRGVAANLVTSALVLVASRFGVPVSTTHVSVGAIAGSGAAAGALDGRVLRTILLSWVAVLPVAALLAAIVSGLLALA